MTEDVRSNSRHREKREETNENGALLIATDHFSLVVIVIPENSFHVQYQTEKILPVAEYDDDINDYLQQEHNRREDIGDKEETSLWINRN